MEIVRYEDFLHREINELGFTNLHPWSREIPKLRFGIRVAWMLTGFAKMLVFNIAASRLREISYLFVLSLTVSGHQKSNLDKNGA